MNGKRLIFFKGNIISIQNLNEMSTKAAQLITSRTDSVWKNGFLLDNLETNKLPMYW